MEKSMLPLRLGYLPFPPHSRFLRRVASNLLNFQTPTSPSPSSPSLSIYIQAVIVVVEVNHHHSQAIFARPLQRFWPFKGRPTLNPPFLPSGSTWLAHQGWPS